MPSTRGRQVVLPLTNKSGGSVAAGDVVVIDTTTTDSFTTTTSSRVETSVGVAQETIANNASGRVLVAGYAALVNVPSSTTRGHYLETHTVAKQATGSATRRSGSFGQFLAASTTPSAWLWGVTDRTVSAGSPVASGARVYNSTAVNLTNGAITLLTFDSERWDDAAYHSTVSNTGRLTVPSAGRYLVGGHVQVTASGGAVGYLAVKVSGTTFIAVQNWDQAATERYASISTTWDCTGGTEYFELGCYIDAASKQALAASSFSPEFWIERIGDT